FLKATSRRMYWLDRGGLRRTDRGFAAFDDWADEIADAEAAEARRMSQQIKAEERYMERGVTARRRRNMRRVERLAALRQARAERLKPTGRAQATAAAADPSGRLVVEAERLTKRYGDRLILDGFSTRILRGDRIGLIGANGAGKTTLLNILLGVDRPDSGKLRQGLNLEIARFDQTKEQLDPQLTPWRFLCEAGGDHLEVAGKKTHVMGYLRRFLFEERQARQPIGALSGGERSRLLLAKLLARPSNLLALDEPTNDLDMDTLDLLEDLLSDYPGTLLLVSHDRDFVDRLVGSVIAVEGDGEVEEYVGGFSEYQRARADAHRPDVTDPRPRPGRKPDSPTRNARTAKLSYGEQRDLDRLPDRIAALEDEIAALTAKLGDSDFYVRAPDAFAAATARLADAETEKDAAETRWLELDEKRAALAR
ncbi:MAG: ATP-binding cassette domain-containing protein, partial [Pseudomonadota bacterium]